MNHSRWRTARERALRGEVEPPRIAAQREQIRLAMDLGQLGYDRRKALGLSEEDLAVCSAPTPTRSRRSRSAACFR
ncbi:hypothetical protein ACPA54_37815 [Uniformispora flossi]|uniref:hypothetical protein n=1 Tax=Uniformispora flossi TaxID=3390723 RepID=UPI003C2ED0AB